MFTIDNLTVTTPSDLEIVMTRDFDAPRAQVYDAFTRPELLRRWYGPAGWSLVVCETDLRPGGLWRFVQQRPDGSRMGTHGAYHALVPPERFVHDRRYDDFPGSSVISNLFSEQDGRTTVAVTTVYDSADVRDGVLRSGFEHFYVAAFARLDLMLAGG